MQEHFCGCKIFGMVNGVLDSIFCFFTCGFAYIELKSESSTWQESLDTCCTFIVELGDIVFLCLMLQPSVWMLAWTRDERYVLLSSNLQEFLAI